MTLSITKTKLYEGDPLNPTSTDIIIQEGRLSVGAPVPEGWRVLTGNEHNSFVVRVSYRYEIGE